MLISACLDSGVKQNPTVCKNEGPARVSGSFQPKHVWGWDGLRVLTSQGLSAATGVSWGWRGHVKPIIPRHITLEELALASPVEVFPFTTIPIDGDVHPHPGPLTPLTPVTSVPLTTTSSAAAVTPLSQVSAQTTNTELHQQRENVNWDPTESTNLPILRPARLRHDAGTQSSPQAMTSAGLTGGQPIARPVPWSESRAQTTAEQPRGNPGLSVDGNSTSNDSSMNFRSIAGLTPITSTQVDRLHHDGQSGVVSGVVSDNTTHNQYSAFGDLSAIAETWDSVLPEQDLSSQQSLFSSEGLSGAQERKSVKETDQENDHFEQALESLPPRQGSRARDMEPSRGLQPNRPINPQSWHQSQDSTTSEQRLGKSSVDGGDTMYGDVTGSSVSKQGNENVLGNGFGDVTSVLSVSSVASVITGEGVRKMDERGRSVSSSDLDSMDPILLGKRQQASQTSPSTTPHPSLENPHPHQHLSHRTHTEQFQRHNPVHTNNPTDIWTGADNNAVTADKNNRGTNSEGANTMTKNDQMTTILQELQNITTELQTSRSNTQKALEDARLETKKTQQAIGRTQSAVDKLHNEIKVNQDKTQQAFHDTHKHITAIQKQVTQSADSLQNTRKELTETKTKAEINSEGIKVNRADIQTNRDDIQQLKDEIREIKGKQTDLADQQDNIDEQNARVDRHMDRQEVINRRSNIVIFGVLEGHGRRRENTEEIVIDVLQTFMPDGDWQPSDCVTAYRAGRRDDSGGAREGDEDRQARPIIATLDRPSDVGFILRHREGREEMRKQGLNCAQDLSRAQQQKIRDIKQEGKEAYYFKGRLVVKDNPYNRLRDNNRYDRRGTYNNRQDKQDRSNTRPGSRQEVRRDYFSKSQEKDRLSWRNRRGLSDKADRADKMVQTSDTANIGDSSTVAPNNTLTDDRQRPQVVMTDQSTGTGNDPRLPDDRTQVDTADQESVGDRQSNHTDTSGHTSGHTSGRTYGSTTRPNYERKTFSRSRYDFFAQQRQQAYTDSDYGFRRQPSGDRRGAQQRRTQGYDQTGNYHSRNTVPFGQSNYNATPPSFLQAPHLQHLANMQGAFVPPPPPQGIPPPMTPHPYPPHVPRQQGGIQEMSNDQWQAMWQGGAPERSFVRANERLNERMNERGQWGNVERARRMREQLPGDDRGGRGNAMGSRNNPMARRVQTGMRDMTGTGVTLMNNVTNAVSDQVEACVCGCETTQKRKANKEQAKNYSHIVIDDSDEKSQPDTEESEYEECVESVSSSEDEGESDDNKGVNAKGVSGMAGQSTTNTGSQLKEARLRIPGAYFGTHSLYDSAKVVDITGRVMQTASEPMQASEQVLEIQANSPAAKEMVTLPDPVQSAQSATFQSETVTNVPLLDTDQSYMSAQSTVDSSNVGQKVITTAQVHTETQVTAEASLTGQSMNEEAESVAENTVPRAMTSDGKRESLASTEITDQSLNTLEKQVDAANARAAEREEDKVASDVGVTNEPRGEVSTPTKRRIIKQTTLSPAGLLISHQGTEDSEMSESSKPKANRPKGKKKKTKAKKKNTAEDLKKADSQKEPEGPTTRSQNQIHSS